MDAILDLIKDLADVDLSRYKRSSIERSVDRRMHAASVQTLSEYTSLLRNDPRELHGLVSDITVDFSFFFRDEKLFEILRQSLLPDILSRNRASGESPLRVWCAGCGAGEEAYSIAIVLFEVLKGNADRDKATIFATDVDPSSLRKSRAGVYTAESMKNVSSSAEDRYFLPARRTSCPPRVPRGTLAGGEEASGTSYRIKEFIKRMICFGKHDLLRDPPISRIDLLMCRNVLIYLDKEGQAAALRRLRYALRPGGYLVLGKSESLTEGVSDSFAVVDLAYKIFRRKGDDKWPFSYQ